MDVSRLQPHVLELAQSEAPEKKHQNGQGFVDMLQDAFNDGNQLQKNADKMTQEYLTGENTNLHEVMLATEKANLALQLTTQVRNKMVNAYQEVFRMQI